MKQQTVGKDGQNNTGYMQQLDNTGKLNQRVQKKPHSSLTVTPLHRAFLATLMFYEKPDSILLSGFSNPELHSYLQARSPSIKVDSVSFPEVLTDQEKGYDILFFDRTENESVANYPVTLRLLSSFKQKLTLNGVLAISIHAQDANQLRQVLAGIRKVFCKRTLCLNEPDGNNTVIFAFNHDGDHHSIFEIKSRISYLADAWGIDFKTLLDRLLKDNPSGCEIF